MNTRSKIIYVLKAMLGEPELINLGLSVTYGRVDGWVLHYPKLFTRHVIGHVSNMSLQDLQNPVRRALYKTVPCKLFG